MAKSPLANDEPDAPRLERRTRIASGPAPMPMPAPGSPLGKPTVPPPIVPQASLTQGLNKKTQVIVGAPPVPPAVTGKTDVPTGPKTKLPGTPVPDGSLPSYQETVIGPAPAPPVPTPPSRAAVPTPAPVPPRAAVPTPAPVPSRVAVPTPAPVPPRVAAPTPVPSNEATVVGPAPVPPKAKAASKPVDPSDAEMDAMISEGLFGDLDEEALHGMRGADATIPAPSRHRDSTAPSLPRPANIPVPSRSTDATIPASARPADATIPAPSRSIDATVPAPGRGAAPVPVPGRTSDPISVRDSGPIAVPARTSDPISVRDSVSGPIPVRDPHSGPVPVPPRPSGPAPKAIGRSDTLPNAELRTSASTLPSGARPAASLADTQHDLDADDPVDTAATQPNLAQEAAAVQRPSTGVFASRPSRAATQSQGADLAGPPVGEVPKVRLVAGKVIPGTRYEIRRWLGEGGMGVVYEVVHTDIERRSALKILRFDLSQQPQMAQVFRDEARAASRLGSPNIVEVYDFGELPDGRLFFAMELLEGADLVPPDEKASMDPGRLIGILRQVCKGLHRAHEAGVVHRDVKPENIILCTIEGRPDHVKIVDFGISAMLAAGERRIGIAGTPQYMAPEQVLGEDFDGRLDVYALGCTAYELLAGKPPFDGDDVETILHKQVNVAPVPIHQVRPDVQIHAELEAVIMKCLAKSPAQRWANMADLEAALCEAQIAAGIVTPWDDLPVPPLPDDERRQRIIARMPSRDIVLPSKRSWLWPAVAAVSTLAAAGLAAFLVFGFQPTEEEKDLVEQLTIEARDAASKAAWVIPPPHLDTEVTALIKVGELDALEGSAENLADDRAAELRHEFATTLIGHGDALWDKGGKEFARQYYAWSLMFEPNDEAFNRANIEMMTLEMIRQRVIAGEFSDADRLIAGVLALKVEEDPTTKEALNVAVNEGLESDTLPAIAVAQIERSARSAGMELRQPSRGSGLAGNPERRRDRDETGEDDPAPDPVSDVIAPPEGAGTDDELVDDVAVEDEDPVAEEGRKKRRQKVDIGLSSKKSFDPARSKTLTDEADAKRKQGLRNEAKSLYGQAIAADPTNGEAHLGLALVHFDQGSYHQARRSAERAVKNSNRNGRAYKILGDALFKEFLYQEAEEAYENAQRYNVNVGTRLTEVRKKLGK